MLLLTTLLPRAQKGWVEGIQYRVSFTSTMLGSMRSIKLLGLSHVAARLTQALRVREVDLSSIYRRLLLIRIVLQNAPLAVCPLVTFGVYIALNSSALSSNTAFSVLSILGLAETPLRMLIVTFPMVISSTACFIRIQEFLISESRKDHRLLTRDAASSPVLERRGAQPAPDSTTQSSRDNDIELSQLSKTATQSASEIIILDQCSFGWSALKPRIAQDINLRVRSSTITMIIGPVGCGKSTLLKGMLGETFSSSGFVYTASTRVALAEQDPWVANTTIAENVRCQSQYDSDWYNTVIDACGLSHDLSILPEGDQTMVGSRGITLSGGQKQRLALARCVYAKQDIVFLDDVFSGLDADTEEHIFSRLFTKHGLFRKLGTTVVFVTHAVHLLPYADYILALDSDGKTAEQGNYPSLTTAGGYVQGLARKIRKSDQDSTGRGSETGTQPKKPRRVVPAEIVANQARKTGDWATYKYYFMAAGTTSSMLSLAWSAFFVLAIKLPGLLVTYWTEGDAEDVRAANSLYLSLLGVLAATAVIGLGALVWQVLLRMSESRCSLRTSAPLVAIEPPTLMNCFRRCPTRRYSSSHIGISL